MKNKCQSLATGLCALMTPGAAAATPVLMHVPRADPTPQEEALIRAAGRGDVARVERLLQLGVSVNAAVPGDGTPLTEAARSGRDEMVRHLVRRGAHINQAVPGDGNPLIMAAAAGQPSTVQLLLDLGADVSASIDTDENALIRASWSGQESIVRLLISRGADVNAKVGARTALKMARLAGHAGVEAILKRAGAAH